MAGDFLTETIAFAYEDTAADSPELTRAKEVARRMADIYSAAARRRITLKEGPPKVDGSFVYVDFADPMATTRLEKLLAHILFRTDPGAKRIFLNHWVNAVSARFKQEGLALDAGALQTFASSVSVVLESRRVLSLLGRVYAGVAESLATLDASDVLSSDPDPDASLLSRLRHVSSKGVSGQGKLASFEAAMARACLKVEGGSYVTTLVATRGLLTELVTAIVEEMGESSPTSALDELSRSQALNAMLKQAGADSADPVEESKTHDSERDGASQQAAAQALSADPFADLSEAETEAAGLLVKQLLEAMETSHEKAQTVGAHVVYRDLHASTKEAPAMSGEDAATVERLRRLFARIQAKRRITLQDEGFEVDVPAYLERRLLGTDAPIFRAEDRGQGFRALILLDMSVSMLSGDDPVFPKACRAARVMAQALVGLPRVELDLWGFTAYAAGQLDIARVDLKKAITLPSLTKGLTPTHVAVEAAAEEVRKSPGDRIIYVVTDGLPVWARRNGIHLSMEANMALTRTAITNARSRGVRVRGIMLGEDVDDANLTLMYGREWSRITGDLGRGLEAAAMQDVVRYLRR